MMASTPAAAELPRVLDVRNFAQARETEVNTYLQKLITVCSNCLHAYGATFIITVVTPNSHPGACTFQRKARVSSKCTVTRLLIQLPYSSRAAHSSSSAIYCKPHDKRLAIAALAHHRFPVTFEGKWRTETRDLWFSVSHCQQEHAGFCCTDCCRLLYCASPLQLHDSLDDQLLPAIISCDIIDTC